MFDDKRTLNILKAELIFLKLRGYSPRYAVPDLFFEGSPGCIKRSCPTCTCSDCALIQLVPREHRSEEPACRWIPLDDNGTTLDLLYNHGNSRETAEAVENWLEKTTERLENERLAAVP